MGFRRSKFPDDSICEICLTNVENLFVHLCLILQNWPDYQQVVRRNSFFQFFFQTFFLSELPEKRIEVKIEQKIEKSQISPLLPANDKFKKDTQKVMLENPKNQNAHLPANMQSAVKRVLPSKPLVKPISSGEPPTSIDAVFYMPVQTSVQNFTPKYFFQMTSVISF